MTLYFVEFLFSTPPDLISETTMKSVGMPSSSNKIDKRLIEGEPTVEFFPCPPEIGRDRPCQYYKPDWKEEMDIETVLTHRTQQVRSV